jgi:hypothetical protein
MDWQYKLIDLFLFVCDQFDQGLWVHAQRQSNNHKPEFCDEEVVTIYLFGIMRKHTEIKAIHAYTRDHLLDWFPRLPSYQGFVNRLNELGSVFHAMIEPILMQADREDVVESVKLIDSMPVMMAKNGRSGVARVARDVANRGYCSSKKTWYHGVKVHALATRKVKSIPLPEMLHISAASDNDLSMARPLFAYLQHCEIFADKIYRDAKLKEQLKEEQQVMLFTPVKRKKGQKRLHFDQKLHSTAVSRMRQPIESLFNWIQEKTGIEMASKVRSTKGLMVHVFGRLAAAMFMLVFYS